MGKPLNALGGQDSSLSLTRAAHLHGYHRAPAPPDLRVCNWKLCFPTGMCLWGWGSRIAARSAHALLIVSWEVLCARRGDVKLRERDISSTVVTAFAWMSMQQKYCNGFINYGCPKGKTGKTSLCPRGSVCYAKMDWLLHLT